MNIIFGDSVKLIPDSYTVLELDTVRTDNGALPFTAYCIVDKIPLHEFPLVEAHKKLHADVIKYYREQHWDFCEQAIEELKGKWAGAVDTFYEEMQNRVREYRNNPPGSDWDGTYSKLHSQ
jgi:adenylate cyclase